MSQTRPVINAGREAEYRRVLSAVQEWASREPDVRGVAVVGSWARGTAGMESDVDIVVLTDQLDRYVNDQTWVGENFDGAEIMRTEAWGTLTEVRLRLPSGLEVELGFAPRSWAATDPVDPGTALSSATAAGRSLTRTDSSPQSSQRQADRGRNSAGTALGRAPPNCDGR